MGDVNLEIKLSNLDERVIKIEESDTPITVDSELSDTSINPVQNKVITATLNGVVGGDEWTAKSYTKGSAVIYNNKVYYCKKDCLASNLPTDTNYWEETSLSKLNSNKVDVSAFTLSDDKRSSTDSLLNIINNYPKGIHQLIIGVNVEGNPYPNEESFLIVFKGNTYGNAYTRLLAFQNNNNTKLKIGMVIWNASQIQWADLIS